MKSKIGIPKNDKLTELVEDLRRNVDGEVRFDSLAKALYSTDGSNYRQIPIGVVIPRTKDTVENIIRSCRTYEVPVIPRGGGTALAGQSTNEAVMIDFSKYLNQMLELDPRRKIARVQPGTILDVVRTPAQKLHNLTFAPDPSTHNHCTLGGMLGNNSCGTHSIMAGRTSENVIEMEILTYDGLRIKVGKTSDEELENIIVSGGRRGEIYRLLKGIRDKYASLIRQKFPDIPRRVSGFNLDDLLSEKGFNVAAALVGTEGTCVTILEAVLNLVESPPGRALLVLGYPDISSAADHIMEIMDLKPVGCEGIDKLQTDFMIRKKLHVEDISYLPDGNGWIVAEFGGEDFEDAKNSARKAMEALNKSPAPPSMRLYADKEEESHLWEIRESGLGATANVPGVPLAWPGWEDSAVKPEKLGPYLRDFRKLLDKHGLQAALYGHFGQGCLHCRITFDLVTKKGIQNYISFINGAADLCLKYGGSFSGEHGDGQSRAWLLPKMYGSELVEAFNEFKSIWDPQWKMNPGKVTKPDAVDKNLRLGTNYNPWNPKTYFKFTQDGGSFARATLRCVGVGKCRRTVEGFMCPSFFVTREEQHTTRGRARALFEMFRQDVLKGGWSADEVKEVLDLCLGCKGCKKECPVNVDMATYKSEFLTHYYRRKLRPRNSLTMGLIGFVAPIAGEFPFIANIFTQLSILSNIVKLLGGIAQKRPLPAFANEPFTKWYSRMRAEKISFNTEKTVVLYPDVFNNYFYPRTLKAAYEVLRKWGYHVVIPQGRIPESRPLIHYGMLGLAKRELERTIKLLSQYVRDGIAVIVLEPSSLAVFRDELPDLLPNSHDGMRVTELTMQLSEFIEQNNIELPLINKKGILHGHCHQKAVLKYGASKTALKKMKIDFSEPQNTCCGMAGSFGFEAPHYETSISIAELELYPAIRAADSSTLVIADGFSCRTQIKDGTGRNAYHLAEVIAMAMKGIL